jgi:pyruvate dehydrogenase E2 component (dihydrolipoamide acetyltransferase)
MAQIEMTVPDIGDFAEVGVIELLVQVGDTISAEQSLITVESDKASMEIPSSHAGVIRALSVKLGDQVRKGSVIGLLETSSPASASPVATTPAPVAVAAPAIFSPPSPAPALLASTASTASTDSIASMPSSTSQSMSTAELPYASPSVRQLARVLGVPLDKVRGTGPKERITPEDVQGFVRAVMGGETAAPHITATSASGSGTLAAAGGLPGLLPWPQVDFSKFGPIERKNLSRIQKISGANLHRNWVMIPHVTNHDDADITDLEAFRVQLNKENEKTGIKVTLLAFMIKAAVAALRQFPQFNASLDGDTLVLKNYFHIGFAADTPNGLVVPVIKNADQKGIFDIAKEMTELAKKARDGKLSPAEMTGGCFSISSLGGIGGRYFTPIINAPEVAIVGVCKSQIQPIWDGKAFAPRLILPLSLSWDHRVIDGAAAARFNAYFGSLMADFRRVGL